MKRIGVVFFLIAAAVSVQAQTLSWNIRFLKGNARESVSILRPVTMETGESFQIYIAPESDCYSYVICYDSEREIVVLKNSAVKAGSTVALEPVDISGPPGTETVYVIMSLERQTRLESLIQAFDANPTAQNANNLYREVVNLQNTASGLGEPASSFIVGGGTTRGAEGVNHFSGKGLYVRPISIRH